MADLRVAVELVGKDAASGPIGAVQKALGGLGGAASAPLRALGSLTSALGAIGLAAGGINALAGAAKGLGSALGVGLNSELEGVRAQLMAFVKDGAQVDTILKRVREEADRTPFSFQEMAKAVTMLQPASKASGIDVMALTKQAEILGALNPAEGIAGGAFSLREALSGDFVSVMERFNIPRTLINQLKEEGVPAAEVVGKALERMGVDFSLVSNMAGTLQGRWSTFNDTIEGFRQRASAQLFDGLKQGLEIATGLIEDNREAITGWVDRIGGALGTASQAVNEFFAMVRNVARDHGLDFFSAAISTIEIRIREVFGDAAGTVFHGFIDAVQDVGKTLSALVSGDFAGFAAGVNTLVQGALGLLSGQFEAFGPTGERLGQLFGWIGERIAELNPGMSGLTGAAEQVQGGMGLLAGVVNTVSGALEGAIRLFLDGHPAVAALVGIAGAATAAFGLMRGAMLVSAAVTGIQTAATWLAVTAQGALNLVMTANPIGLVVVALAGIAAALIYAYKTNETFRNVVNSAWQSFKAVVIPAIKAGWDAIVAFSSWLQSAPETFRTAAWNIGKAIVEGIGNGITSAAGWLRDRAAEMALGALAAAKAALRVGSPSKAFEELGEFAVEGFALGLEGVADEMGATLAKTFSILEEAENAIAKAQDDAIRGRHRAEDVEAVKHGRRMADLETELGTAKGKAREAVLAKIEDAQTAHQRRVEDIEERHQNTLIELEFDAADRLAAAERKQRETRGVALQDFLRDMGELERDVALKSASIGRTMGEALRAAQEDAARAIAATMERAAEQYQAAQEKFASSRILRGVREAFGLGQEQGTQGRSRQREDEDREHRRQQGDLSLGRKREEEDVKARRELDRDLARARTDEERNQVQDRHAARRDELRETRRDQDRERAAREREETAELARRRQRSAEDSQFRKGQALELQAFNDGLELNALQNTLGRIVEERDSRVQEIGDALEKKQRQIEAQAAREREALATSYEARVADLRDKFVAKLGPVVGEAQTTLTLFLDSIATRIATVAAAARDAGSAVASIGGGDGGSGSVLQTQGTQTQPGLGRGGTVPSGFTLSGFARGVTAADSQALGTQSADVQAMFASIYGDQAAERWKEEHERELRGFATGGSFLVGGQGSADSQLVSFRASPDEEVTIRTPGQREAQGSPIIVNVNVPGLIGSKDDIIRSIYHGLRDLQRKGLVLAS